MTTFFVLSNYLYSKLKQMLFNLQLINPDQSRESLLLSGSSWSNCVSYAEGTGKEISLIQLQQSTSINIIGTLTNNSYVLTLKDNITLSVSYTIFYSTFDEMVTWLQSLTDKTLVGINSIQRQFITI
jgi:hypothetical protein